MTKNIILLLLIITKIGFSQTVAETALSLFGQAVSEKGIPSSHIDAKFHNGLIIINTDTIKGQIKIVGKRVHFFNDSVEKCIKIKNKTLIRKVALVLFFPFVSKDPKKNFIKTAKVTSVRIFSADTLITKHSYMDFIHIDNSKSLYRKIYSGSIEIYDDNYCTDEYPGYIEDRLVVVDNGTIIPPSNSSPKKHLVTCINKKFNKDLKASDFKQRIDVIRWLKGNDINAVDQM